MMLRTGTTVKAADGEMLAKIGDRITDKSAALDDGAVRKWIGRKAFGHWAELRSWIDESYPGVFAPDWLYGGKNRGWSLRYKEDQGVRHPHTGIPSVFGFGGHGSSRTREV